jgi:hypothetical protein
VNTALTTLSAVTPFLRIIVLQQPAGRLPDVRSAVRAHRDGAAHGGNRRSSHGSLPQE